MVVLEVRQYYFASTLVITMAKSRLSSFACYFVLGLSFKLID